VPGGPNARSSTIPRPRSLREALLTAGIRWELTYTLSRPGRRNPMSVTPLASAGAGLPSTAPKSPPPQGSAPPGLLHDPEARPPAHHQDVPVDGRERLPLPNTQRDAARGAAHIGDDEAGAIPRMAPRASTARRTRGPTTLTGGALRPRVKIWVVLPSGTKLGDGRARLLELIDEVGSIRKAARQMGMSYRAARGYIRELESAAGFKFLTRKPGGGGTGGAWLTKEARAFLTRYRRFSDSLDQLAQRRFARAFRSP